EELASLIRRRTELYASQILFTGKVRYIVRVTGNNAVHPGHEKVEKPLPRNPLRSVQSPVSPLPRLMSESATVRAIERLAIARRSDVGHRRSVMESVVRSPF